ncbi:MAG: efflux RND transporter permease subunit, partial [Chloroflexi bacterium]|nr:efflux RND transporter permease subunit [Chloroflexota bacterium]
MSFLTGLALSRRPVTVLIMILVLVGGILTYRSLPVELFPDIEFPLVTVATFYPSASSETVVQDVTLPIENAISSLDGLENIQSTSLENRSIVLANFTFGTDMDEAERIITSNLNNIVFPSGVNAPRVGRINSDSFPAIMLSVLSDREIPELQQIVQTFILPAIESVDGVFSVEVAGGADRQVLIDLDTNKLSETGISVFQVMSALRENNVTLPAGAITEEGQTLTIRISNTFNSLE